MRLIAEKTTDIPSTPKRGVSKRVNAFLLSLFCGETPRKEKVAVRKVKGKIKGQTNTPRIYPNG